MRSIHAGIQSMHALHEMYEKYLDEPASKSRSPLMYLRDWASNHKTVIVLKGGEPAQLQELYQNIIINAANELELPTPVSSNRL